MHAAPDCGGFLIKHAQPRHVFLLASQQLDLIGSFLLQGDQQPGKRQAHCGIRLVVPHLVLELRPRVRKYLATCTSLPFFFDMTI